MTMEDLDEELWALFVTPLDGYTQLHNALITWARGRLHWGERRRCQRPGCFSSTQAFTGSRTCFTHSFTCHVGHELTKENIYVRKNKTIQCKLCHRARALVSHHKRKLKKILDQK